MDTSTPTLGAFPQMEGEYHRNGCGGCGFRCTVNDDAVTVQFIGCHPDTGDEVEYVEPIRVPLAVICGAAVQPVTDTVRYGRPEDLADMRSAASDGNIGIVTFDIDPYGKGASTMVAITVLDADPDDKMTAVFQVNLLTAGEIRFGHGNSWRGDYYHRVVLDALNPERTPA